MKRIPLVLACLGVAVACSENTSPPAEAEDAGVTDAEADVTTGTGGRHVDDGGTIRLDAGNQDAEIPIEDGGDGDSGDECASISSKASVTKRPIDIIFVIDNSGSMGDEIDQVRQRINEDFAAIIDASEVDYRVIMFTTYGVTNSLSVCVGAPLGPDDCTTEIPEGTSLHNPPRFFHYDVNVQSRDSLCLLLDHWTLKDGRGDDPWSTYLRREAFKVFVEITDDAVGCGSFSYNGDPLETAKLFDQHLRELSPEHFGIEHQSTYDFYSIVGMVANDPVTDPWPPDESIQTQKCTTAANAGVIYQALSRGTGALRWSVCENDDFSPIFQAIAGGVVRRASIACKFNLPSPPAEKTFDYGKFSVGFIDEDENRTELNRVPTEDDCDDGGWHFDSNTDPKQALICPDTCDQLRAHDSGVLDISIPCEGIIDIY